MSFKKTVFISDTHGFRHVWTTMLKGIGLLDDDLNWTGGSDVRLVHVGDHTDRGEDSVGMYRLMTRLKRELPEGQIVLLIGNHDLQYLGGPPCGAERHIVDELAEEMQQDLRDGITQFAYDFEANDGSWLVVHAGMSDYWHHLHTKPVSEAVEYINSAGVDYLSHEVPTDRGDWEEQHKRTRIIDGIGGSRGGGGRYGPEGVTWADYWYDLRVNERDGQHRQIVGHTIQPNGIECSPSGRFWGINVHYNHAQALVYDHESGEFSTTDMYAPHDSPYLTNVTSKVIFHDTPTED